MRIKVEVGQVWCSPFKEYYKITSILLNDNERKAYALNLKTKDITPVVFTTIKPDGFGLFLENWNVIDYSICIEDCCRGAL